MKKHYTMKKCWEDLKSQYQEELEEEALSGEKPHEARGERRSHEIDVTSEKDSAGGGSHKDQDSGEQRLIENSGSSHDDRDPGKGRSDEYPVCKVHRLTKEGFNAMHFIRDQINPPLIPCVKDNQLVSPPRDHSEALQPETLQTPESSHTLELEPQPSLSPSLTNETEESENSKTAYLTPIPLKNLGALEGGPEEFMQLRGEIERLAIERFDEMEIRALADSLQYVGSDSDDDFDDYYGL